MISVLISRFIGAFRTESNFYKEMSSLILLEK